MTKQLTPEYIFETSWEVCNKVGGIYTVLSTRARTLQNVFQDKLIFIGPDIWQQQESPYFEESAQLLADWRTSFNAETGLNIRVGRWKIHGSPITVLVDFQSLFEKKNEIYAFFWERYGVDSIHAYGDYDESSMFGYASGMVIESYYRYHKLDKKNEAIAHFNEWMTTFGAFYIQYAVPEIASVFTTHATSIGRSIAGNNKPLYDYLPAYNGDQMAYELNMQAKHSAEKHGARIADCFTTVSVITGLECAQLLDKKPDIITPNGFENDFVPKDGIFDTKRAAARDKLRKVTETMLGYELKNEAVFIASAGRYEYKNKGIDVFIQSLKELSTHPELKKEVVAFIMVPAHIKGVRPDLQKKLHDPEFTIDYWNKHTTHELYDYQHDNVVSALQWFHLQNLPDEKVKVIFVPSYLNGNDGIFNMSYWDLLIGMDLTVFPSYYEPWGYTPLESIAFSVPTITTDLSGFGQWVKTLKGTKHGVEVVHRSDYNFSEVAASITSILLNFTNKRKASLEKIRKNALDISQKALWSEFIHYYFEAYHIALKRKNERLNLHRKTKK